MLRKVVLRELIARQDMEGIAVNLHVTSNGHIRGSDESAVVVNILVSLLLEEGSVNNARVLLGWLVDRKRVVTQIEGDDESSVDVLWHASVEPCGESENFPVIVDALEEVALRLLGHKLINISKSIGLVAESIVGGNLSGLGLTWFRHLDLTKVEVLTVLFSIELLGEIIHALNAEDPAESIDLTTWLYFIAG